MMQRGGDERREKKKEGKTGKREEMEI